jgi:hypothetical protein
LLLADQQENGDGWRQLGCDGQTVISADGDGKTYHFGGGRLLNRDGGWRLEMLSFSSTCRAEEPQAMTTLIDTIDEYITEKERRWIALLVCLDALLW